MILWPILSWARKGSENQHIFYFADKRNLLHSLLPFPNRFPVHSIENKLYLSVHRPYPPLYAPPAFPPIFAKTLIRKSKWSEIGQNRFPKSLITECIDHNLSIRLAHPENNSDLSVRTNHTPTTSFTINFNRCSRSSSSTVRKSGQPLWQLL